MLSPTINVAYDPRWGQLFMETHPDAAKCPKELTMEGTLVWFCEPRDVEVDQSLKDTPVRVFKSAN